MKKLFFTAIALIAFSGVSMANIIDVDKTDSFIKQSGLLNQAEQNFSFDEETRCNGVYGTVLLDSRNRGIDKDLAECIAFAAYVTCLGYDNASIKKSVHVC